MTTEEKTKLIETRKQELAEEHGLTCPEEIVHATFDSFLEEFFFGEMSREDLEEYASLMGLELHLNFVDKNHRERKKELC